MEATEVAPLDAPVPGAVAQAEVGAKAPADVDAAAGIDRARRSEDDCVAVAADRAPAIEHLGGHGPALGQRRQWRQRLRGAGQHQTERGGGPRDCQAARYWLDHQESPTSTSVAKTAGSGNFQAAGM